MKLRNWLYCLLLFFLTSCLREDCSYITTSICEQQEVLGRVIKLAQKDTTWLAMYYQGQVLELTNKKGYTTSYTANYKTLTLQYITLSKESIGNSCCSGGGTKTNLLPIELEFVKFNGNGSFGPIVITREKSLEKVASLKDSLSGDNIEEKLTISVKNNITTFNPNDTGYNSMIKYQDTLTILDEKYEKVFALMPYKSAGEIPFSEFYYSKKKGLIGFKLLNDELWILK